MNPKNGRPGFRLLRRLIGVISLVGGLAIAFLWIATERRTWLMSWSARGNFYAVRSDAGRLCFERVGTNGEVSPHQGGWCVTFPDQSRERFGLIPERRILTNGYGFTYWTWNVRLKNPINFWSFRRLTIPYWPLLLVCVAPWAVFLICAGVGRRRRARVAAGLCPACGYDLRASAGRCPECGTPMDFESLRPHASRIPDTAVASRADRSRI